VPVVIADLPMIIIQALIQTQPNADVSLHSMRLVEWRNWFEVLKFEFQIRNRVPVVIADLPMIIIQALI
jgi:hypothetical protein